MNLEDRLRAELDRSGRSTKVGVAPGIDELASVADGRRQRNRRLGAGGTVVLGGAVIFGALLSTVNNDPSIVDVAADAPVAVDAAAAEEALADVGVSPASADAAVSADVADVDVDAAVEEKVGTAPAEDVETLQTLEEADDPSTQSAEAVEAPAAVESPLAQGAAQLQAEGELNVQKRESAVELASASGVLVENDGAGGYVGLAVAFGDSTTPLSLSSPNGLDWTSADLVGVPNGASASVLREYNGTYVALFERFDANAGVKQFLIGTSADTVTWDVSAPLPGGEVFATDMAVGSGGVIVIGDNQSPDVWAGPLGGPYTRTGRLDARALSGVTTVDGQFVVAGRSSTGSALFTSSDATAWVTIGLGEGAGPVLSANDGTVMMRSLDDSSTLISNDAGATWSALPASTSRGVTVSNSTMGFLGGDASGAVVAVADEETFSSAALDVAAPDRLALVAAGNNEIVMVQTTESGGTTWIVAQR